MEKATALLLVFFGEREETESERVIKRKRSFHGDACKKRISFDIRKVG